jgi:peptide-methionine (S)-S-oxide reductase
VQVDYDPAKLSYTELLDIFWENAPAGFPPAMRQYTLVIFYNNEQEKQLAEQSLREHEKTPGSKTYVVVLPMDAFYLAENYHQKYYLKGYSDLYREFKVMYPDEKELNNSTAAARVNSYAAGLGNASVFDAEINNYGLSAGATKQLKDMGNRLFPQGSSQSCASE